MRGVQNGLVAVAFMLLVSAAYAQQSFEVRSPSGTVQLTVTTGDTLSYTVTMSGKPLMAPSTLAMITGQGAWGTQARVVKNITRRVRETIVNPVPIKRKNIPDHFDELTLAFRHYAVVFRAYDDGIAYRFVSAMADSTEITNEVAAFRFATAGTVYFPEVQKRADADVYHTSFEEPYRTLGLSAITPVQRAFTPVLVDAGWAKAVITESDLVDYPGMFLRGTAGMALRGEFAAYPKQEQVQGGEFKQWVVTQRQPYIARVAGSRTFPWRVVALAENDGDLLTNDLVYRLGAPPATADWNWVKPGIATDEWICGINLKGVGFKAGINTETYKHYIDFAKRFGMHYVMLDAGWSDYDDLFKITPGIDLEALAAYARYKNIGLMLWTLAKTLDRQLEPALKRFSELGIRMIMTDFMDRDDQKMMRFYTRVAEATARHRIMIMYHGAFKNAGFERTWPHAITREGVLGSEYNIWSDKASPEHDVLLPFIRMVAGPMDYEPGFYENANQRTFRPLPDKVMSQGTRTHQLAMFVAYDSPLQIFSGNPSDAWPEVAFTTFLASLPTSWDDTRVVDAKLGDYLVMARRKDKDWYLVAMNDWTARTLTVDLSFLGDGRYFAFTCADGPNATKNAEDYTMGFAEVNAGKKLTLHLAPGGGYVAKLIKQ